VPPGPEARYGVHFLSSGPGVTPLLSPLAPTLGVMNPTLVVEPSGESQGHCDCCGNLTRTVWGYLHEAERTVAAYFVQWTASSPDHFPNIDFILGTWGTEEANDRVLSSWQYNPGKDEFMIIDAASRPAAKSALCSHALSRDEVLSAPEVKKLASHCIDAVWLQEARIQEVRSFAHDA
jgi:hypothetical protein